MKKKYFFGMLLTSLVSLESAHAQHSFSNNSGGLNPYTQNFDFLASNSSLYSNHLADSRYSEIYAESEFGGYPYYYAPGSLSASDGSAAAGKVTPDAGYYHFGYASGTNAGERSFGGIASTDYTNGVGYVGIRFKNTTTSTVIKNLEVQYAMEQWYNSGRQDAAQVDVAYLLGTLNTTSNTYTPVTSLLKSAGTWQPIADLTVKAPSTATVIANRDGNSAANRRVAKTTISVNLQPGQEIMIRWAYALDNTTNGNGLSIDDVVVTPETNVFYSNPDVNAKLNLPASWDQSPWVTGQTTAVSPPANFTADNQIFYVMSTNASTVPTVTDAVDRLSATWTVGGVNSKIIVGTPTVPAAMRVESTKNVAGIIDVSPNSYFLHRRTSGPKFTFGTLASTSTVEYNSGSTAHSIQANQYGNLSITGGATGTDRATNLKTLAGPAIVAGTLTLTVGSNLELLDNDLTVLSSGSVTGGAAKAYVITDGKGRLRLLVPRAASSTAAGTKVTFPIGNSVTSYTPVTLLQTSTASDDVFEARVIDGVSSSYDASYTPNGTAVTSKNVLKTWLISKEVPTNTASVTMGLTWNSSENSEDFMNTSGATLAHINHYTASGWDTYMTEQATVTGTGPYTVSRSNITSFSPFAVSSRADGTLPVELTAFTAQRTGAAVRCTWTTASELHSRSFSVERSLDGNSFDTLGEVAAAGTSATAHTYSFVDSKAVATTAYYRLRQTDLDGQVAYSPIVAVEGTALEGIAATVVPNPSTGLVEVSAIDIIRLEVLNTLGQAVLTQQPAAPAQALALDLSAQSAGVYLVRVHTAQGTRVVRVVKN